MGYAANERWSVSLDDHRRVFDWYGAAELLAGFLRERRCYVEVQPPFMPRAGLPPLRTAPRVRDHQHVQLAITLAWVRVRLGL